MGIVLRDAAEIRRKIQSVLAKRNGRRYAIVAFVGRDALDFVPEPRGLIVYCWPHPMATSPDGLRALIYHGKAKVYFVDRLHMKLFWSESRGALLGSCNLTRNALGDEQSSLAEIAYYTKDASEIPIEEIITSFKAKRTEVNDAVLEAFARKYNKASARRDQYIARGKRSRERASRPPTFAQYVSHPGSVSWSMAAWEELEDRFPGAVLAAVENLQEGAGRFSGSPRSFIADSIYCEHRPRVDDWILCYKIGKTRRSLAWVFAHLVVKPRKNARTWNAVEVKLRTSLPPFDCSEERFAEAFRPFADAARLTSKSFQMNQRKLAALRDEYFHDGPNH